MGAWGELIGGMSGLVAALGVIATLLYLARQVHQNTKSVQSSAYAAYVQGNAAVHESHMASAEVLPEYLNGRAQEWGLESTSAEYMKFHGHANQVFTQFEMAFLLYKDGTVDREFFESKMTLMKFAVESLPGLQRWWNENAHHQYDVRFRSYVSQFMDGLDFIPNRLNIPEPQPGLHNAS